MRFTRPGARPCQVPPLESTKLRGCVLSARVDDERARAAKWGVKDLNRKYGLLELVSGDVVFSATGVTDGSMLRGVHREGGYYTTESVVMRSATGTVRWIKARHSRAPGA